MSKSVISACFQVLFVLPADRIDGVSSAYRAVVTDCVGHVASREADCNDRSGEGCEDESDL